MRVRQPDVLAGCPRTRSGCGCPARPHTSIARMRSPASTSRKIRSTSGSALRGTRRRRSQARRRRLLERTSNCARTACAREQERGDALVARLRRARSPAGRRARRSRTLAVGRRTVFFSGCRYSQRIRPGPLDRRASRAPRPRAQHARAVGLDEAGRQVADRCGAACSTCGPALRQPGVAAPARAAARRAPVRPRASRGVPNRKRMITRASVVDPTRPDAAPAVGLVLASVLALAVVLRSRWAGACATTPDLDERYFVENVGWHARARRPRPPLRRVPRAGLLPPPPVVSCGRTARTLAREGYLLARATGGGVRRRQRRPRVRCSGGRWRGPPPGSPPRCCWRCPRSRCRPPTWSGPTWCWRRSCCWPSSPSCAWGRTGASTCSRARRSAPPPR